MTNLIKQLRIGRLTLTLTNYYYQKHNNIITLTYIRLYRSNFFGDGRRGGCGVWHFVG